MDTKSLDNEKVNWNDSRVGWFYELEDARLLIKTPFA
jgi:hypothetical protein